MSKATHIDRATDLHRAGRLDEAADLYRQVLRADPNHADALHLLGLIAYQRGADADAIELIRRALAIDGAQVPPHNHLGMALLRQGQLDDAAACFARALELGPTFAPAHNNLGIVRQRQKRTEEAAACYRRALTLDPNNSQAHFNLGLIQRAAGDLPGAAACFRKAIAINPSSADALGGLAEVLLALGQAADADPHFEKALALVPKNAAWHGGRGDALQALGKLAEACVAYQQALALDDGIVQAWWGLGCAQSTLGEYAAAVTSLGRLVTIAPERGDAWHNLATACYELGQVDRAVAAFGRAAALLPRPELPLGGIATIIPGSPSADNAAVRDARRTWAALAAPEVQPGTPPPDSPPPDSPPPDTPAARTRTRSDGRLRLGYVSAFFQDRNWMKPVWGLINHHDRDRFELHLFSDAPESTIKHGYTRDPRDHFHNIAGLTSADAARRIEAQEIDVLIDLNGYSRLGRLPMLARKPAPVLVAWFNSFAPSGMSCYDYLIGDEHVIPPHEEVFYRERIVRVPGSYLTFEVTYPVPEVGPAPCLSRGALTFGCLAPQYKITGEVVETWARILSACPDTRLILKNRFLGLAENRRFVHDLFQRSGVAAERVELQGPAEHFDFLATYNQVDLAVDTFPYNGGTTTMEALWQGVPVLTFSGDRWAARIGASLLRSAGLPEYVAPDVEGYVARAVELAKTPDTPAKLDALRRSMRDRLRAAPVCSPRTFARDMEREYLRMRDRQSGLGGTP